MRSLAVLAPLLLFAGFAVTVAICSTNIAGSEHELLRGSALWGLAIAQVQLAAAALVFVRRSWALRVAALIGAMIVWCCLVSPLTSNSVAFDNVLALSSVAILIVAGGGALHFCGWKLATPQPDATDALAGGQFSLATLALTMAVAGVYCGLLSHVSLRGAELRAVASVIVQCSLIGSTLFLLTSNRLAWIVWALAISSLLVIREFGSLSPIIAADVAAPIALVQSAFLAAVMLVLNVAGVRLQYSPAPRTLTPVHSAALSSPRSFTSS